MEKDKSKDMPGEEAEEQPAENLENILSPEESISSALSQAEKKTTFLNRIFDKETRLGRFMRSLIRWAVIVGVCFCAGIITAYFVLYQPVKRELAQTKVSLVEAEKERDSFKTDLEKKQDELAELEGKYSELEESSKNQSAYVLFLELDNRVRGMMYAISVDDLVTAKVMMDEAQKYMTSLQPIIKAKQDDLASLVQNRLNVASSELGMNNREGSLEDLQRLRESLNLVYDALFAK